MIEQNLYASELACLAARLEPVGTPHTESDTFCSMCGRAIVQGTPSLVRKLTKSFSDYETLRPSDHVCGWCAAITPQLVLRAFQRVVITRDGVYNLNKDEARAWFWLTPPEPPFAVVINDGSALSTFHYVWRTPVTLDKRLVAVNFDGVIAHVKRSSIEQGLRELEVLRTFAIKDGQKHAPNSPFKMLDRSNFSKFHTSHGNLSELTLDLASKYPQCQAAADFFTRLNNSELIALSSLMKSKPAEPVKPALQTGQEMFEKDPAQTTSA